MFSKVCLVGIQLSCCFGYAEAKEKGMLQYKNISGYMVKRGNEAGKMTETRGTSIITGRETEDRRQQQQQRRSGQRES